MNGILQHERKCIMKKVFVVDDNTFSLLVAEELLSEQYDVYTLSSPELMFNLLGTITPNLILLDLLMPETSGFDVLKQLKADPRYSDIPVLIITGRSEEETEDLCKDLGALGFIRKPFSKSVLLDRVASSIGD